MDISDSVTLRRRVFLSALVALASGCLGSGHEDDFKSPISAEPVNESETNESIRIRDYNDTQIQGYGVTRKAVRHSYNDTVERGEPQMASFADRDYEEVPKLENISEYSPMAGRNVVYIRYRGMVFRITYIDIG